MTHARLTKLSTLPGGVLDPHGAADGSGPIREGYTVLGHYDRPPTVGEPFEIERYERNGVKVCGVMTTSPVADIVDAGDVWQDEDGEIKPFPVTIFRTENSWYELYSLPTNPAHPHPSTHED